MPIVKTDTGYWPGYEYKRQVRYTNKDGFSCSIPPEAARVVGFDSVGGKDCGDCIRNWERAMENWETALTVTTKVILYRVQRNIFMSTRPDFPVAGQDHHDWKCTMSTADISFCEGMALAVTAGVFEEKAITINGKTHYSYDMIQNQLPDSIEEKAARLEHSYGRPDDVKHCVKYLHFLRDRPLWPAVIAHSCCKALLVRALALRLLSEPSRVIQNVEEMSVLCRGLLASEP